MRSETEQVGNRHLPCVAFRAILQHVSQGRSNLLRVQSENKSRPDLGCLGKMAGGGDDHRNPAGHRFQDGNTESFLATGQAETRCAAERGALPVAMQGPDEMHARFKASAGYLSQKPFPVACIGARHDKMHVRERTMNDFKGRTKIIEPLLVMQTAEEKHGACAGKTVGGLEEIFTGRRLKFFNRNAVGDRLNPAGQPQRFQEPAFVGVQDVQEGGPIENSTPADAKASRFFRDFWPRLQGSSMPCGVTT